MVPRRTRLLASLILGSTLLLLPLRASSDGFLHLSGDQGNQGDQGNHNGQGNGQNWGAPQGGGGQVNTNTSQPSGGSGSTSGGSSWVSGATNWWNGVVNSVNNFINSISSWFGGDGGDSGSSQSSPAFNYDSGGSVNYGSTGGGSTAGGASAGGSSAMSAGGATGGSAGGGSQATGAGSVAYAINSMGTAAQGVISNCAGGGSCAGLQGIVNNPNVEAAAAGFQANIQNGQNATAASEGQACIGNVDAAGRLCTPAIPAGSCAINPATGTCFTDAQMHAGQGQGATTTDPGTSVGAGYGIVSGGHNATPGDPLSNGNWTNQVGAGPDIGEGPPPIQGTLVKGGPLEYRKDILGAAPLPLGKQLPQVDPLAVFDAATQGAANKLGVRDYSGAVAEARKAVQAQPQRPEGHELLAEALRGAHQYAGAEQEALQAIEARRRRGGNPRQLQQDLGTLAYAQLKEGKVAEAFNNANRAVDLDPENARARFFRAMAEEALGRRQQMIEDLREAAKRDPRKYKRVLERVLAGGKIFDPDEDTTGLMDAVPRRPIRSNPFILVGLLALLLAAFTALAYALRGRLAGPRLSEAEKLKLKIAEAVAAGEDVSALLPASPPVDGDKSGLLAGKYQMNRIIGKGGMGQVWEARDYSLERPVAIKKMSEELLNAASGKGRELYIKEARTLASLRHPNIVAIYEILDQESGLYLVFELVTGKTVQHILAEKRSLPLPAAKQLLKPVCEALQYAHEQGVAHRDLKPANIMVTEQGMVKVMDFGLARRTGETVALGGLRTPLPRPATPVPPALATAKTQTIAGTPAYMAPEALRGTVAAGSDVYALGIILYEMVTGERPFGSQPVWRPGESRSYVKASVRVPGLSTQLDALIDAAIEPRLEARLPSAKEFLARLEAVPEPVAIS